MQEWYYIKQLSCIKCKNHKTPYHLFFSWLIWMIIGMYYTIICCSMMFFKHCNIVPKVRPEVVVRPLDNRAIFTMSCFQQRTHVTWKSTNCSWPGGQGAICPFSVLLCVPCFISFLYLHLKSFLERKSPEYIYVLPWRMIFVNFKVAGPFLLQTLIPAFNLFSPTKASHTMTSLDPLRIKHVWLEVM